MAMRDNNRLLRIADKVRDFIINFDGRLEKMLERFDRIELAAGSNPIAGSILQLPEPIRAVSMKINKRVKHNEAYSPDSKFSRNCDI